MFTSLCFWAQPEVCFHACRQVMEEQAGSCCHSWTHLGSLTVWSQRGVCQGCVHKFPPSVDVKLFAFLRVCLFESSLTNLQSFCQSSKTQTAARADHKQASCPRPSLCIRPGQKAKNIPDFWGNFHFMTPDLLSWCVC